MKGIIFILYIIALLLFMLMLIHDYKTEVANAKNIEKDKIIDLMAEYISKLTDCPFEKEKKYLNCEEMCDVRNDFECWKVYFEKKAKELDNEKN